MLFYLHSIIVFKLACFQCFSNHDCYEWQAAEITTVNYTNFVRLVGSKQSEAKQHDINSYRIQFTGLSPYSDASPSPLVLSHHSHLTTGGDISYVKGNNLYRQDTTTVHSKNFVLPLLPSLRNVRSGNIVCQDQEFYSDWCGENNSWRNDTSNLIVHCVCGQYFRTRRIEQCFWKNEVGMMDRGCTVTGTIQSSQDVNRAVSLNIKNVNTQQTMNSFQHNYRAFNQWLSQTFA